MIEKMEAIAKVMSSSRLKEMSSSAKVESLSWVDAMAVHPQ